MFHDIHHRQSLTALGASAILFSFVLISETISASILGESASNFLRNLRSADYTSTFKHHTSNTLETQLCIDMVLFTIIKMSLASSFLVYEKLPSTN